MTRWIDAILLLLAAEAAALALLRRTSFLPTLAAGALLLLAMRLALDHAWPGYVAASLLAGGIAHALDLRARWRN